VDKVLHECVYSKTLDNITAVMIAFENFENVATMEHKSGTDEVSKESYNNMIARKSLEPVQEEFIESEADTPIMLPSVVREVSNDIKN